MTKGIADAVCENVLVFIGCHPKSKNAFLLPSTFLSCWALVTLCFFPYLKDACFSRVSSGGHGPALGLVRAVVGFVGEGSETLGGHGRLPPPTLWPR